jgi:hypothetical protein
MVKTEYIPKKAFEEVYFNILKVFGVLSDENPSCANLILYADAEGKSITAGDIKIDNLRNAINDIANLKTTTASKEYVDSLVGDINEALETALNGGV